MFECNTIQNTQAMYISQLDLGTSTQSIK